MNRYDPNFVPTYALFLIGVKVIIFNDEDQILLLKRSEKTSRAHGWDFAGGSVDRGESPLEAVVREVSEETGLTIDTVRTLSTSHGHVKDREYVLLGFSARLSSGEVTLSWEHESYQWMTLEEVKSIELPESQRLIMDMYENSLTA